MYEYNAKVIRVVDGDTLWIDVDLGCDVHTKLTVRLYEVNAAEHNTPEGQAATEYVKNWIGNHNHPGNGYVRISTFKDRKEKYGRYLADVWGWAEGASAEGDPNRCLNEMMLSAGHAVYYDGGKR